MKFSEAIALGLPEIEFTNTCWLVRRIKSDTEEKECTGCLVGAALFASGIRHSAANPGWALADLWPWTQECTIDPRMQCPGCSLYWVQCWGQCMRIQDVCTHLASHYEWGELSVEAILDFIRSIEPPDQPTSEGELCSEPVSSMI